MDNKDFYSASLMQTIKYKNLKGWRKLEDFERDWASADGVRIVPPTAYDENTESVLLDTAIIYRYPTGEGTPTPVCFRLIHQAGVWMIDWDWTSTCSDR
jgi:hypothetical protein